MNKSGSPMTRAVQLLVLNAIVMPRHYIFPMRKSHVFVLILHVCEVNAVHVSTRISRCLFGDPKHERLLKSASFKFGLGRSRSCFVLEARLGPLFRREPSESPTPEIDLSSISRLSSLCRSFTAQHGASYYQPGRCKYSGISHYELR